MHRWKVEIRRHHYSTAQKNQVNCVQQLLLPVTRASWKQTGRMEHKTQWQTMNRCKTFCDVRPHNNTDELGSSSVLSQSSNHAALHPQGQNWKMSDPPFYVLSCLALAISISLLYSSYDNFNTTNFLLKRALIIWESDEGGLQPGGSIALSLSRQSPILNPEVECGIDGNYYHRV